MVSRSEEMAEETAGDEKDDAGNSGRRGMQKPQVSRGHFRLGWHWKFAIKQAKPTEVGGKGASASVALSPSERIELRL